ncbi:WD40 repeat-like protein [Anaeromyces robustus]|uniref:WD40 repeat-like protein n=1 Tax=Anaeromyces robustus TaxID=1754192 RepID=A0A1Y1XH84_9FUNG|nr:WD40 repeat-like protein [Anaeromyces robustus]|eukprot:ORX85062.1 WD40 repeat-like protein [Anaeromyces robustus]
MGNENKIENCLASFNTEYPIYSLALRGDKLFVGGGKPNQLPILSCYSIKEKEFKLVSKQEFKDNVHFVSSIAIHPKERLIACGINNTEEAIEKSDDGNKSCKIFKFKNNEFQLINELHSLKGDALNDFQNNTKFNADGTLLLTAGTDGLITMFDTVDYKPIFVRDQGESVLDTHFNETGSLAVSISSKRLVVFKSANGSIVYEISNPTFNGKKEATFAAARFGHGLSKNKLFIIANIDTKRSILCTIDLSNWEKMHSKSILKSNNIKKIDISPSGSYIVYVTADNLIGLIETKTLRVIIRVKTDELTNNDDIITSICYTKEEKEIIIGTDQGHCKLLLLERTRESIIKSVLVSVSIISMLCILVLIIYTILLSRIETKTKFTEDYDEL